MGKIIGFDTVRNAPKNRKGGLLNYARIAEYKDLLEVYVCLMDELFINTEEMLRELHFDPRLFTLVEDSAKMFLSADLLEFYSGGEESLYLSFEATIDNVLYRTYAATWCDGSDMLDFEYMLLKWDGTEWLAYSDRGWERGPGADFFGPFHI